MSAQQHINIQYHWTKNVSLRWYRQIMGMVFGVGVLVIAGMSIRQGGGSILISSVAGMSFLTLLLIFGVEIEEINISIGENSIQIPFSVDRRTTEQSEGDDSGETS